MRLKTLGVIIVTALSAFTLLYWITDTSRRESIAVAHDEELLLLATITPRPGER